MDKKNHNETNIESLLPEALRESLSSLHIEKLQEAFDAAVEKKAQERVAVAVKSAEANFDAVVNERLETLVAKMEEANKVGVKRIYDALNERAKNMKNAYDKRIAVLKERNKELVAENARERRAATTRYLAERSLMKNQSAKLVREAEDLGRRAIQTLVKRNSALLKEEREGALKALAAMKRSGDKKLYKEARAFKKRLVESVGKFLDGQIDSRVPYEEIKAAAKNTVAMRVVESLKRMLSVDAASTMEAIKAPVNEARQIITESKRENANLVTENAKLRGIIDEKNKLLAERTEEANAKINKAKKVIAEAKRISFLNEKLSTIPSLDQRNYMKNIMDGQSVEFMKENWEYALKRYRVNRSQENAALAQKAGSETKSRQLAEVTRRSLTEASLRVRNAKRELAAREAAPKSDRERLIDDILKNGAEY